ncbi:hypothetical protein [Streptomyces sp. G-G2]|uniref:hypothetical protein n=1 Tax=Streptomyces sp. G-G2 TaxID=3046201 RepID=UPI0024BB4A4B|nr:hypothetical protein [Streptomyces sp. G-G2]MDJ0385298.1 hypothetical protein [Streptomyces sp. G-G2]
MDAAGHIRTLLAENPAYRHRWMTHTHRRRKGEVSYSGIAQVVALHLWETGLRSDTDRDLPRRLRDRIRQALRGEQLTHETVTWLTESFCFSTEDTAAVWDAFAGRSSIDLGGNGVSFTLRDPPVPLVQPQLHRTTALFSHYHLGPDRTLHRTDHSHVLVALEDGVDSYAYSPRDSVESVESVIGGTFAGFQPSSPGFVGVKILLERVLRKGQYASLQYSTIHRATPEACTDLRRAARRRIDNVDMRITYHEAVPSRAWWCAWGAYSAGELVREVRLEAGIQGELHQFFPSLEQAVVGFRWEW